MNLNYNEAQKSETDKFFFSKNKTRKEINFF
jgi:hypothetical protein